MTCDRLANDRGGGTKSGENDGKTQNERDSGHQDTLSERSIRGLLVR